MSLFWGGDQSRVFEPKTNFDGTLPSRERNSAGANVTFDRALTLPAVWACVRLRADLVSSMPVDAFRRKPDGTQVEIPKPLILTTPGGNRVDLCEWLYQGQMALDLRGNNVGLIVDRDSLSLPRQIELVHPDAVAVRRNAKTGLVEYRIGGTTYPSSDVWHERANTVPGRLTGLSPIAFAATAIGVALSSEKFGADWFADGAHPSAVLASDKDLNDPSGSKARLVKDRFMAALQGTREPVVLGMGLKYQAIQVNPNESQFLDTMRWGVQQVARLFGVPPELIGGDSGSSMTYANVEQRSLDFLTYGLGPTLARRERALSTLLPRPQYAKFNAAALLRTDLKTRFSAYQIAIGSKFMHPDEARAFEDWAPLSDDQKADLASAPAAPQPVPVSMEQ